MLSEPRTISLLCELVHLPMKHTAESLRAVYNKVCDSCSYENFIRTASGARLERHETEGEGFSHLTFAQDRMQFTEDHCGTTIEQFAKKVHLAVESAIQILRIPVILVQQATVRVTSTPNHFKSASDFLGKSIFRIRGEDLEPLGRPTSVVGFRLVFPPTQEDFSNFNVRVEAYLRDPRSVYIENVGTFKNPIQPAALALLEKNLLTTSHFVVKNVLPFLSRFDRSDCE